MPALFRACLALLAFVSIGLGAPDLAAAKEQRLADRLFFIRGGAGTATEFQMIVHAGCQDEANGDCRGMAHYLEHLVLVGRSADHNDAAMSFFPDAQSNGWTNDRATVFIHRLPPRPAGPKADLDRLLRFYAARLSELVVSDAEALRERNVILQEYNARVASSAASQFSRDLDRALIPDHPAGQWTIGTPETIAQLPLEGARAFHKAWYTPENAYFVIKADIDPAVLKQVFTEAMAGAAHRPPAVRQALPQPGIVVERKELSRADRQVQQPGISVRKLVRVREGDREATRATLQLLTSFIASRFPGSVHDTLVEEAGVASAVNMIVARVADDTYKISMTASLAPDADVAALEAAMLRYIDDLGRLQLTPAVIERLKKRIADARAEADKDNQQVFGRIVGWLAARQPYEALAEWPKRIAAVDAPAVKALAASLTAPGRTVVGTMRPVAP